MAFFVEMPLRKGNEISTAESRRPQSMMMKAKGFISADLRKRCNALEGPTKSVFHQALGSIPKIKEQPTPFT